MYNVPYIIMNIWIQWIYGLCNFSVYTYIYVYVWVCVCIYIYMDIHILDEIFYTF